MNLGLMNKKFCLLFSLFLFLFIDSVIPASKIEVKDLPDSHKKWLEEDAVYIITPKEKEIFLQLESDKERDMFIEGFWKQTSPSRQEDGRMSLLSTSS